MKRVLTALVLIPLVLLAVFKSPSWLFTLLVGAVALLALKEYLDLVEAYGVKPVRWLSYGLVAFSFLTYIMCDKNVLSYWTGLLPQPLGTRTVDVISFMNGILWFTPFLLLVAVMRRADVSSALPAAATSMFGVYYVGASLASLALLQGHGWYPVIFTFFAVWAGDIVAMYTGKAIGKHKMSPRISPNKTWEGAIGSVVGSVLACWALTHFAPSINVAMHAPFDVSRHDFDVLKYGGLLNGPMITLFAIFLNIAAQLGDLVESLIKRGANVKDSGTMLPGHGGILDRIDALLFAAPVALVLFEFVRR